MSTEAQNDTRRALAAAKAIFDGRDPMDDFSSILTTTEHVVALVLIAVIGDPAKAAKMLNEGLLQGVEARLALYEARAKQW